MVRKHFIKDLRILTNRNLQNIIMVDNSIISFYPCLNNGIYVPSYRGDINDNVLEDLIPILKSIKDVHDVRQELINRFNLKKLIMFYKKFKYQT